MEYEPKYRFGDKVEVRYGNIVFCRGEVKGIELVGLGVQYKIRMDTMNTLFMLAIESLVHKVT